MAGFKSVPGVRHNIDLSDDEQNYYEYGWMGSYNQRAKFVRLLLPSASTKKYFHDIENIKFVTRDPNTAQGPGYNWLDPPQQTDLAIEDFYKFINSHFEDFEHADIPTEYWNMLSSCLELQNFRYERIKKVDRWTTDTSLTKKALDEKLSRMGVEGRSLFSSFGTALKSDMKNGLAKFWLDVLIDELCYMTENFSRREACGFAPSLHCPTNTIVETIQGDLTNLFTEMYYNAPSVASSSSEASVNISSSSIASGGAEGNPTGKPKVKKQTVVPDYCVILKDYPGIFPLVVNLKPAYYEDDGQKQNVKQMLSKLFFQDVVFGMVISPRQFQLSVIIKKQDNVHFAYTNKIKLTSLKDGILKLNLETLSDMHKFIFRVLKFGRKSKCIISEKSKVNAEC